MPKAQKVPITERALIQRINRKLATEERKLRMARGFSDGQFWHENTDLGRYYIVDVRRNILADARVDIEALGRELWVLADWEALADIDKKE